MYWAKTLKNICCQAVFFFKPLSHFSCCWLNVFGEMLNVSLAITYSVITNTDQQMAVLMHWWRRSRSFSLEFWCWNATGSNKVFSHAFYPCNRLRMLKVTCWSDEHMTWGQSAIGFCWDHSQNESGKTVYTFRKVGLTRFWCVICDFTLKMYTQKVIGSL